MDADHNFEAEEREAEMQANHAEQHPDPLQCCDECSWCEGIIEDEISAGKRCEHGREIPFQKNKRGDINTDLECPYCRSMAIDRMIEADAFPHK